ncbi:MAG: type III-A CRISPR-associated protein Csm2 [Lachnospiraceae bacterium]|nr:type III-A CRISPR-associated protein Csm2 [Lachnospiraceae bacterium]
MKLDEKNYVELAEKAIDELISMVGKNGRPEKLVTTSQIRNLLAMTAAIYNDVVASQSETLSDEIIGRINYLKVRFFYEAGRSKDSDRSVLNFIEKAHIQEHIDEIQGSKAQYILFSRYMEALVAFRKYKGTSRDA